eukprot:984976-Prorocentrum_minimum.AAC.1
MTDQSDTGNPTAGLDTDTAELTVRNLITPSCQSRIQFSCRFFTDVKRPCRALIGIECQQVG